jgi:acyl transferase domain-containing protein
MMSGDQQRLPRVPIAIIGAAGRFPGAADVEQLAANLRDGRVSIGPISRERIAATALDPSARPRIMGYLDDIDRFDYAFFGMSAGEARTLSPNARLLLEEAWHAFESSGGAPDRWRGSRTDVYMTQVDSVYADLADAETGTLFTGNSPDFIAARVSRQFDLRGSAVMVDASCASGVAALLMACDALALGRADYALVCGTNLQIFPYARPTALDTWSPHGHCRSFAADADGMVAGEGAVCLLLTPLDRAEAHGHVVRAVIRGGATNNNGAGASSPSAPHSAAQAQVIVDAWRDAGVRPSEIGCIEGHGSATLVGDSLEVEAYRRAFGPRAAGAAPCPLSSVKANIGHGKAMAGLSSIVKAMLSVERGVIFPAPHADDPSAVLKKVDSPVAVNADPIAWRDEHRIAAVHSYGMNGVNCHVVLENAPPRQRSAETADELWPMPLTARSRAALAENAAALRSWLDSHDAPLGDVAHTLALGRSHLERRRLVFVRDRAELARACDEIPMLPGDAMSPARPPRVVMLLAPQPERVDALREVARQLARRFPAFARSLARLDQATNGDGAFTVAFQLALHQLLGAMGIAGALAGNGIGKLVASALTGAIAEEQALRDADAAAPAPPPDLDQRIAKLVASQTARGPVVFLSMGFESAVSRDIRRQVTPPAARVEALDEDAVASIGGIVARLFADGCPIRFEPWFEGRGTASVVLPGYRFARTRCWLRDAPKPQSAPIAVAAPIDADGWEHRWAAAPFWERTLAAIWRDVIGVETFTRDDRWFDLGADSLAATRIVRRINEEWGVRCDFEDIFDRPTIAGFVEIVREQCTLTRLLAAIWRDVLKTDAIDDRADFFALGGHSLLASDVLRRVRQEIGVALSFDDFFGAPTPAALAALIEQRMAAGDQPPDRSESAATRSAATLTAASWSAALRRREMP